MTKASGTGRYGGPHAAALLAGIARVRAENLNRFADLIGAADDENALEPGAAAQRLGLPERKGAEMLAEICQGLGAQAK